MVLKMFSIFYNLDILDFKLNSKGLVVPTVIFIFIGIRGRHLNLIIFVPTFLLHISLQEKNEVV